MTQALQTLFPSGIAWGEVVFGVAAAALLAGYIAFLLAPAWSSYGRVWERMAAGVLTLFMLAALLGVGTAIGFAAIVVYERNFV